MQCAQWETSSTVTLWIDVRTVLKDALNAKIQETASNAHQDFSTLKERTKLKYAWNPALLVLSVFMMRKAWDARDARKIAESAMKRCVSIVKWELI